jgi:hypothetical protein
MHMCRCGRVDKTVRSAPSSSFGRVANRRSDETTDIGRACGTATDDATKVRVTPDRSVGSLPKGILHRHHEVTEERN